MQTSYRNAAKEHPGALESKHNGVGFNGNGPLSDRTILMDIGKVISHELVSWVAPRRSTVLRPMYWG